MSTGSRCRHGDLEPRRQERYSDATAIRTAYETIVKVDAARRVEVSEHMLGADFLKGKDVWLDSVDDLGEASNLVVVLLLRRRSVHMADRK